MLWDEGFDSWTQLGVVAQPAAVLFSSDGRELGRWSGAFDEADVLRLIGA